MRLMSVKTTRARARVERRGYRRSRGSFRFLGSWRSTRKDQRMTEDFLT